MEENNKDLENRTKSYAHVRFVTFGIVVLVSLTVISLFGIIGKLIDTQLETSPIFTIVLILVSFPVNQYAIYKVLKKKYKDV